MFECVPEPTFEGGIMISEWPGKKPGEFKDVRFQWYHQPLDIGIWPHVSYDSIETWKAAPATVIWTCKHKSYGNSSNGRLQFRAFYGAPCWTQKEVQLVCQTFNSLGIRVSMVTGPKLVSEGVLGDRTIPIRNLCDTHVREQNSGPVVYLKRDVVRKTLDDIRMEASVSPVCDIANTQSKVAFVMTTIIRAFDRTYDHHITAPHHGRCTHILYDQPDAVVNLDINQQLIVCIEGEMIITVKGAIKGQRAERYVLSSGSFLAIPDQMLPEAVSEAYITVAPCRILRSSMVL
jgi:hypothetical protein